MKNWDKLYLKMSYCVKSLIFQIGLFSIIFGCGSSVHSNAVKIKMTPSQKAPESMPYRVNDKIYYPIKTINQFSQEGVASWYGPDFHGKLTSNLEVYNMNEMTAAHKILPFNTILKVENLENGKQAVVRINDRGPFVNNRIIDLSYQAANKLGILENGTARVRLTALNPNPSYQSENDPNALSDVYYSVQIGIFEDVNNATRLEQATNHSRTESFMKEGQRFYRVLVGKFNQYEHALKKMDHLHSLGLSNAFIIFQ